MTKQLLSAQLEHAILDGLSVGVLTIDASGQVLSWNRFMEQHSNVPSEKAVGQSLYALFPELPQAWLERKVKRIFDLGNYGFVSWRQRPYLFAFPHNRPITGGVDHMHQDCTLIPLRGPSGAVEAVCITLVDATDASMLQRETERSAALLRDAMGELERLSERDGLTGICNRRTLDRRLAEEMKRFGRYGTTFSVVMFDIDHFKKINDGFGHPGGDEVLRVVARRVESALRDTDTLGRYGGEEFMILLPSTSGQDAAIAAERVRKVVASAPVAFGGATIDVTISMGVCQASAEAPTDLDLVHQADAALYEAKAAGRNCVRTRGEPRARAALP